MPRPAEEPGKEATYGCGWPARLAPRVLAGAVVVTVLLVTSRFQEVPGIIGGARIRVALWVGAGLLALWVLNKGAELRLRVGISDAGLTFRYGAAPADLRFGEIETLRFDPPFAARKSWVAATALLDERGRSWRLPVALEAGEQLLADLIRRSGREDLATWAEVLGVERRMRRRRMHTVAIYATALVLLVAGITFFLR